MFTPADRLHIRQALVAQARADDDITGAALVGSVARGKEDAWSDIDLVLQLAPDADEACVAQRWTRSIDDRFTIADTLDVIADGVRYRVFLLASSLQIDVSFWPHDRFRATQEHFHLLFGSPQAPQMSPPPDTAQAIGMGWLYALHARSALARDRLWQAASMIDHVREQVITLTCVRHGVNPWHGREVDLLPIGVRAALGRSRAARVTSTDLRDSFQQLLTEFRIEIEHHDPARAKSLRAPFAALAAVAHDDHLNRDHERT